MSHYLVFKVQLWICFLRQTFVCLWWRWGESNSWPPACKAGALPAELHPRLVYCFGLFPLHYFVKAHDIHWVLSARFALYCKPTPSCCHIGLAWLPLQFTVCFTWWVILFKWRIWATAAYLCTQGSDNSLIEQNLVGLSGLEPPTSRLSGVRSNRLSYRPMQGFSMGSLSLSTDFLRIPTSSHILAFNVLCWTLENKQYRSYRPIGFWLKLVALSALLRKEVIQPHLPIRLPCYDFTPITNPTFDCCLLAVSSQASGVIGSHGVTGGVYKARERIHRGILIRDY